MCSLKSTLFSLLAIATFTPSFSQSRMDTGLRYEFGNDRHLILEDRIPVAYKTRFIVGISFANGFDDYSGGHLNVENASDTLVESRQSHVSRIGGDLRFGISRELKWPVFSVRADILLGYRQSRMGILSEYEHLDNGFWQPVFQMSSTDYPVDYASLRSQSLNPGGSVSFNLDLPLGKRFFVNMFVAPTVAVNFVYSSEIMIDPLDEFINSTGASWGLDFDMRCGAGLRYIFGKEKVFVKRGDQ